MPESFPENPEKPPDDLRRAGSLKDEGQRRWLYLVVKVFVLVVVSACLLGVNTVGVNVVAREDEVDLEPTPYGVLKVWMEPSGFPLGWPLKYTVVPDFPRLTSTGHWIAEPSPCIFANYYVGDIHYLNLSINLLAALAILIYVNHVVTVIHRRWKPTYRQYSLRTLLTLPVLLGVVMALAHYGLLSWRGCFLTVVYIAVLACTICFVYEVRSFMTKNGEDARC